MTLRLVWLLAVFALVPRTVRACVFVAVDDQPGGTAQPAPPPPPSVAPPAVAPPASPAAPAPPESLDFDLLGKAPEGLQVDPAAISRRRTLLNWHQAVGLGMFAVALANTVVGQLNYDDKFNGTASGRYQLTHTITASATVLAFAATGLLALLAPTPIPKEGGFDRLTLHKIAMTTAAAGMASEVVLGLYTASREGYLNQQGMATAHLIIGYATFAALALGVGVIVF